MDEASVVEFFNILRCQKILRPTQKWIKATCPLAPATHGGKADENPSFGVSIHEGGESNFRCFSCGSHGSLPYLLHLMKKQDENAGRRHRIDYDDVNIWLEFKNLPSIFKTSQSLEKVIRKGYWTATPKPKPVDDLPPPPLDESELSPFVPPTAEVLDYLRVKRKLTDQSIRDWGLCWHEEAHRIGIPIRDHENHLVGVSGRAWSENQKPKFLHTKGFRRDFYLYGENHIRRGEPGFLTEGFFDVISMHQRGFNAVAIMGTYISKQQIQKCADWFSSAVIFLDGDAAGSQGATRIYDELSKKMDTRIVRIPSGKDPDELTDDELRSSLM